MTTHQPEKTTVRTRFAPSPSGHLHVGGARTALFCWAFAKGRAGKFILRIEDTDQKRSSDAASEAFLEDLCWLGIKWDEGPEYEDCGGGETRPYFQSQRLAIYRKYLDQLLAEGKAYRAFETAEELAEQRAEARKAGNNYRYDRGALSLSVEEVKRYDDEGRPFVIRLNVDEVWGIIIHDEVLGDAIVPAGEIDDFVICKMDGYPTYHFAVVVDDELMKVTHVLRAQEHFKNTAKHLLLQKALGFAIPVYAHMPIMCNPDGSKMSKRDQDRVLRKTIRERNITESPVVTIDQDDFDFWLSDKRRTIGIENTKLLAEALEVQLPEINVDDFRRSGYLPEVLCNFLALNGWSPGHNIEKFDMDFLQENFDLKRVMKAPAKFDRSKLLAFNLDYIQEMNADEFIKRMRDHATRYHMDFLMRLTSKQFDAFARASQARSKTLDGPFRDSRFFILDDADIEYVEGKAVRKALLNGETRGLDHLRKILPILEGVESWDVEGIDGVIKGYAEEYAEGKLGKVAQPLRIAVTGTTISPAIGETLAILGKTSVIKRIHRCLQHFTIN